VTSSSLPLTTANVTRTRVEEVLIPVRGLRPGEELLEFSSRSGIPSKKTSRATESTVALSLPRRRAGQSVSKRLEPIRANRRALSEISTGQERSRRKCSSSTSVCGDRRACYDEFICPSAPGNASLPGERGNELRTWPGPVKTCTSFGLLLSKDMKSRVAAPS
jgi:hypothetical protein